MCSRVSLPESLEPLLKSEMETCYGSVAIHYGVSTAEFFTELAQAFLFDKDGPGPKDKLSAYYHGIVKAGK